MDLDDIVARPLLSLGSAYCLAAVSRDGFTLFYVLQDEEPVARIRDSGLRHFDSFWSRARFGFDLSRAFCCRGNARGRRLVMSF